MNIKTGKMKILLIRGLEDQGPGDILGAVGGATDISPGIIGNISINNGHAAVEVPPDKAKKLAKQLDGSKVGNSRVSVKVLEDEDLKRLKNRENYIQHFHRLVEMEREEEMREHEESIRQLTGPQRQDLGKAILHLRGRDEGKALEGQKLKFMKQKKGEQLPETQISVGDLVMISRKDPLRDDNPTGTVIEKTKYSVTVAFDHAPDFIYGRGLRMDLYVNDITYQRMKEALERLRFAEGDLAALRDIFAGGKSPVVRREKDVRPWYNTGLNDSQKRAVEYCLGADDIQLIHGPPGTGKTTTVIEVIEQSVASGQKVLAAAASNAAVDNMLEFLLDRGISAVRIGHPARVTPRLKSHTLDHLVTEKVKYRESEDLREQAFELKDQQDSYIHPSGRYRRGMSNEKIRKLAEENRGSRGVSAEKIKEMARWIEIQQQVNDLFERADALRERAVDEIIDGMQVVCTTNSSAGSDLMDNRDFDLAVIDETTQATVPGCLIPVSRARKVVMAGDHKQLPPTVKNRKAAAGGLRNTLFERMAKQFPGIKRMLKIQYRMNQNIMEFVSREFYGGELEAHEDVKEQTLADLKPDVKVFENTLYQILDPEKPLVFVDTSQRNAGERIPKGSTSRENPWEADLVQKMAENLIRSGIEPPDLGIISPYKDQVDLLDRKIDIGSLEIKSVDGFQGREKEVVMISLTRSNSRNEIGFLKDVRRLNVALSRARRKLVVVGDSSTLETDRTYRHFLDYVRDKGVFVEI